MKYCYSTRQNIYLFAVYYTALDIIYYFSTTFLSHPIGTGDDLSRMLNGVIFLLLFNILNRFKKTKVFKI